MTTSSETPLTLYMNSSPTEKILSVEDIAIKSLPNDLAVLKFDSKSNFNEPLFNLPSSLRWLELSDNFNQPIHLNEGLEYVKFGKDFDQEIVLPSSLICLEVCENFSLYNLVSKFCNNLREIRIIVKDGSDSQYVTEINHAMKLLSDNLPKTVYNIMIGDLYHKFYDHQNVHPVYFIEKKDSSIYFALTKQHGCVQSIGQYVRIENFFCKEIQQLMDSDADFILDTDFIWDDDFNSEDATKAITEDATEADFELDESDYDEYEYDEYYYDAYDQKDYYDSLYKWYED